MRNKEYAIVLVCLFLVGCASRQTPAPVESIDWKPYNRSQKNYTVRKGDTLYSIAWRYDKDYKELAVINHLNSPYHLSVGQKINLTQSNKIARRRYSQKAKKKNSLVSNVIPMSSKWVYPTKGSIVQTFAPWRARKGVDISGRKGQKVVASNSGRVAYAGNGLPGYGNLIIIKHADDYLSAYAFNRKNLVHEGQKVKVGQVIAEMGHISKKKWGLHFEIRKAGRPVNPLKMLNKG